MAESPGWRSDAADCESENDLLFSCVFLACDRALFCGQARGTLQQETLRKRKMKRNPSRCPQSIENRQSQGTPVVVWKGKEYQRVECGLREVRVCEIQGPEWIRAYCRWSLRVGCYLLDEPGEVSAFFNLGNYPAAPSMGKSRQSRIYRLVTLANGGPPRTGEAIDFQHLLLDKFFMVRIEDCLLDSKGQAKTNGEVYSRITEFVRRTGP